MKELDLDYIRERRKALKLSNGDMAEKLGFSNSSVYWKYENGVYKFNADVLPALAKALECDLDNFFKQKCAKTEHRH